METKTRLILRHVSGLYLSWSPDSYPHTKRLSQARRFYDTEQIIDFLQNSFYKPDRPEEYEIEEIEIEYRLKESVSHANQESGTEESETAARH